MKFDSVDALVAQMARDCDDAARRLGPLEPGTVRAEVDRSFTTVR